jgi:hypothetical protein
MAKSPGGRQDWDPWQPLLPQAGDPLWRDDFSNLLHVIRWPQLPLLGDIQIPAPKQNPAVIAARRFGNASALFSKTAKEIFTMQI